MEQRLHLSAPLPGASRVGRWRGAASRGEAALAPLSSAVVSASGSELVVRLLHDPAHAGTSLTAQFAPGDRAYDEDDPASSAEVLAAAVGGPSLYADAVHRAPRGASCAWGWTVRTPWSSPPTRCGWRSRWPSTRTPPCSWGPSRAPRTACSSSTATGTPCWTSPRRGWTWPIRSPPRSSTPTRWARWAPTWWWDAAGNAALTFAEGPAPGGGVGASHVVVHRDLLVTGRVVGELASEPLPPLSAHPTEQGDLVSFPVHTFQLPPFSVDVPYVGDVTSDLFTEALGLMQARGSFGRYYTTVVPGFRGKVHSVGLCTDVYCSVYVELRNHTTNERVVLTSSVLIGGGLHLEPTFTALLELTDDDTLAFGPADRIAVAFGQGTVALPGVNVQAQLYLQADLTPVQQQQQQQ